MSEAVSVAFRQRLCTCGHPWVQHQNDEDGCWGPSCLNEVGRERCQMFVEAEVQPDTKKKVRRNVTRTRHDAPETSHLAAKMHEMKVGTIRYQVFRAILLAREKGMTDEEIEGLLGKKHQTVSATRNTLMNDELIVDSGQRRQTTSGADAIVWVTFHQRSIDNS